MTLANGLVGVLLMASAICLLRWRARLVCRVDPEKSPEQGDTADTRLGRVLDDWNDQHGEQSDSLCFPLGDARESFLSRIELARLADRTIDAQYYVFHDDESGRGLLAMLIAAAERGVRVRLLLDDIDLKERDALLSRLAGEIDNLEIRIFNPLYLRFARPLDFILRFPRSSRRMHNKSFTVDAAACVVGGRNIGDEYFGVDARVSFSDYDMLAAGKVASDVVRQFDAYWCGGLSLDCAAVAAPAPMELYQQWLLQVKEAGQRFVSESDEADELPPQQLIRRSLDVCSCDAEVLCDPPEKVLSRLFDTDGSLTPEIMTLMRSARRTLLISSPYLIPGSWGMDLFRELRQRGVEVTVLTNSFAANDVLAVHAGYIDYRRQMVELGIRLYEFMPDVDPGQRHLKLLGSKRSSLHAKTFLIDRERLFVGSFNLDPRSAIHNTEMGIVFENATLAARLHGSLTDRLEEIAYHLKLDAQDRLLWEDRSDQNDAEVHHLEPNTTHWQRMGVYLMSWLPVEWLL
ncbi:phospholipase D family protein [Granulosicoccus sp. 3-233]|uniref:phospholipase D family protein n=1 Tax=Granulosicoccus sp. 3-233 TaxID=3417969 RepID=UPI003D325EF9